MNNVEEDHINDNEGMKIRYKQLGGEGIITTVLKLDYREPEGWISSCSGRSDIGIKEMEQVKYGAAVHIKQTDSQRDSQKKEILHSTGRIIPLCPANQQVDSSVWNQNVMNTTHVSGLTKSSHHIHHMPNMAAMVPPRNMFGWDSYLDLKVIYTALIEG